MAHDWVLAKGGAHHLLVLNDLPCGKEHRVDVVEMHLLQLRVLHFLKVCVLRLVVIVSLVFHLLVLRLLGRVLRVDAHELRQRAHRTDHALTARNVLVDLHFHHFVPVLSAVRP